MTLESGKDRGPFPCEDINDDIGDFNRLRTTVVVGIQHTRIPAVNSTILKSGISEFVREHDCTYTTTPKGTESHVTSFFVNISIR